MQIVIRRTVGTGTHFPAFPVGHKVSVTLVEPGRRPGVARIVTEGGDTFSLPYDSFAVVDSHAQSRVDVMSLCPVGCSGGWLFERDENVNLRDEPVACTHC